MKKRGLLGRTLLETHHGNPGEHRVLPCGILVRLIKATNIPQDSPIKWWAHPYWDQERRNLWPKETESWANGPGVGLHATDVRLIHG